MPIALLVLAFVLRSVRLLLLPMLMLIVSIAVSFGAMYFVTYLIPVMFITPSVMMSMLVSVCARNGRHTANQ
jgi:RND superfamily putative drug exporter